MKAGNVEVSVNRSSISLLLLIFNNGQFVVFNVRQSNIFVYDPVFIFSSLIVDEITHR
jgi:hypothetical protein